MRWQAFENPKACHRPVIGGVSSCRFGGQGLVQDVQRLVHLLVRDDQRRRQRQHVAHRGLERQPARQRLVYGIDEDKLYDRDSYQRHYTVHNLSVADYFRYRGEQLLVLNLADPSAMRQLCAFVETDYTGQAMPHLNRSTVP